MKAKIMDLNGNSVNIDNSGNENGNIRIEGYLPLKKHLDLILNEDIELIFLGEINAVPEDLRLRLPDQELSIN